MIKYYNYYYYLLNIIIIIIIWMIFRGEFVKVINPL